MNIIILNSVSKYLATIVAFGLWRVKFYCSDVCVIIYVYQLVVARSV